MSVTSGKSVATSTSVPPANRLWKMQQLSKVSGDGARELPLDQQNASTASAFASLTDMLTPTEDPQYLGRLGGYEVCGLIGRGSTGIVLKAFEPKLNRFVAIKVLSPALADNGAARQEV